MDGVSILALVDIISEIIKVPLLLLDKQGEIIYASPYFNNQGKQELLLRFYQAFVINSGTLISSQADLDGVEFIYTKIRIKKEPFYLFTGHFIKPKQEQQLESACGQEMGQLLLTHNLYPNGQRQLTQLQTMTSILGELIVREYQIKELSRQLNSMTTEQLTASIEESLMHLEPANKLTRLTRRQLEVLKKLAEAKTNRQIAAELQISEKTIKVHVSNILHELAVKDRMEAVLYYLAKK
ncbi:MAG TPA: LuxR C-terminal-related transcriptional regulator [Oscillospiraceae bacterium]|nr:LuxR C-terminal-related transcriptional regulator [Oscillospiraceae bacterium]